MSETIYIGAKEDNAHYLGRSVADLYVGRDSYFQLPSTLPFNPEVNLGTPTETQTPGTFDWTGPATGSEQVVFGFDFNFPTNIPSEGMIFEQGGAGRGILLIIRNGHLRFRFGDGGVAMETVPTQGFVGTSNATEAKYIWDVPVAQLPFDGNNHTIVWEVDPIGGHRAWADGNLLFDDRGSNRVEGDDWTGGAGGGFLRGGTNINNDSNFASDYPVQSGEVRMYLDTLVTAVPEQGGGGTPDPDPPTGTNEDQFVPPISTTVVSGSITRDHTSIDELVRDDSGSDSVVVNSNASVFFGIPAEAPANLVSQRLVWSRRAFGSPTPKVSLRQGTTEIASITDGNVSSSYNEVEIVLTQSQMESITDYSDLNVFFENTSSIYLIGWLQFQIITN